MSTTSCHQCGGVVGYTYRAANFCPSCIVAQLTTNPGNVHHQETQTDPAQTERHLDLLARLAGVDRMDERTFDSDDFPKVVFSSQVEDVEYCDNCGCEL